MHAYNKKYEKKRKRMQKKNKRIRKKKEEKTTHMTPIIVCMHAHAKSKENKIQCVNQ